MLGLGPLDDLIKMIPGMNQVPGIENVKVDPKDVERKKAMVYSMTPAERANPDLLNPSRRRRIAAGSGNSVVEAIQGIKKNDATNVQRGYEHPRYGPNVWFRRQRKTRQNGDESNDQEK